MSALVYGWLQSLRNLPIEGLGQLEWERHSAHHDEKKSLLHPPQWVLLFSDKPETKASDDFFTQLSCFGSVPVAEAEREYRVWLKAFQSDLQQVDCGGLGKLIKNDSGVWEWNFTSNQSFPVLPVNKKFVDRPVIDRRLDTITKLFLLVILAAMGWLTWLFDRQGLHPSVSGSCLPVQTQASDPSSLPYLEIR